MTTTSRQNNLILNQDWKRIYQTFKNADFKSYDFENLRRVMLTYLRENYPEDFNDYIESSEYMALIDAIAFIGQSLSFRIDLASRENFLELADRKESVLRLARTLGYNAKRNIAASGLLKFSSISTTETIVDSNGRNLSDQVINWNDPTNNNWLEQFLLVLNAAMAENTEFGRSQGFAVINGISTEQYRFNSAIQDVPIFSFNKTVSSRNTIFELVSTSFKGRDFIYEEPPTPGNQLGFLYRQDGRGPASANTGFFLMFKQGSLELADFVIDVPTVNEKVSIDAENINNDDIWLFSLDSIGRQQGQWTPVSNLIGNNIVYNSITNNIRNIYSVITKDRDQIELQFADGVYGNLPRGSFRVYYRVSNGLSYSISPPEMKGINISIPYISKSGTIETLSLDMGLNSTVSSSSPTESVDRIKQTAPSIYYTQNRMITAEDYQLAPLSSSQDILKVKSINRSSSGISRNFDIIDASGRYSSVNVFADDGYFYKKDNDTSISFKFTNRAEIINFIRKEVEPLVASTSVYNFYLSKFDKIFFSDRNIIWENVTSGINESTGYFKNIIDNFLLKTGTFTTNNLKFCVPGALLKFVPPEGKKFKNGKLVDSNNNESGQEDYLWTRVIRVTGDGTNNGTGITRDGKGAVIFSDNIPSGSIVSRAVPKFVTDFPTELELEIINQLIENQNFGLRYDVNSSQWKLITAPNIDLTGNFNLGKAGDITRNNLDGSWIISFVLEADRYVVKVRGLDYIFGSLKQNRFYIDVNKKIYNSLTGEVVRDKIKILGINTRNNLIDPLNQDLDFFVDDTLKFKDGFESASEIKVSFADSDDDGIIDNPDSFEDIAGEDLQLKFLFFKQIVDSSGIESLELITDENILIFEKESQINPSLFNEGQLIYFYEPDENVVKRVVRADNGSNILRIESAYSANFGRNLLKFQYIHNSDADRRIDPSVSNIIDIFLLIRSYDTEFRKFIQNEISVMPEPPSSESLRVLFGSKLNAIKSISDEVIYHPAKYKVLFGSQASENLRAVFKIVKNPRKVINDNDLKVRIVSSINEFFDVNNWDFGDTFYLSELTTYVLNSVSPDVSNLVIMPRQLSQGFGDLFEIQSRPDEIFVNGATVDDIEIVPSLSGTQLYGRN